MTIYRNSENLAVKVILRASEVSKIVFKQKPPPGCIKYANVDLMNAGKFIESYLVNQIGNVTGLSVKFIMNRENTIKKILEIGDIDVYIRGRADGRAYATYMTNDKLIRYDYIIEVKHLITQSVNDKELIINYYKPQILSYNILYNLPVIFYAILRDGFIFDIFYYDEVEISKFKNTILKYVESRLARMME
jgi:hypothetical protein